MRRSRRLLNLLESYAPTRQEWADIALEALRQFGLPEPDITSLRRSIADELSCRRSDRAT